MKLYRNTCDIILMISIALYHSVSTNIPVMRTIRIGLLMGNLYSLTPNQFLSISRVNSQSYLHTIVMNKERNAYSGDE